MSYLYSNIVKWTKNWRRNPTTKQIATQIGCHFEEFAEMLEVLPQTHKLFGKTEQLKHLLQEFATAYKEGDLVEHELINVPHEELLDALCDQVVTGTALGTMLGYDMEGGLREVNRSNWSKFTYKGEPIFDENGKLKKGDLYTPPNLKRFIGERNA